MPTFVPPVTSVGRTTDADPILAKKNPLGNKASAHFRGVPIAANVYAMQDGTVIGHEPEDYTLVRHTYQGGHVHTITAAEAAVLVAAGYTVT
jgi:hypothetical protein